MPLLKTTTPKSVFVTLIGLYIAQAIPLYLVAAALPPILRERGVDLAVIGAFAVLLAPWVLKFLWAPYVDRLSRGGKLGRKAWIIATQCLVLSCIFTLSSFDPVTDVGYFFPLLMMMSVGAATQDIATDGYAVEHLASRDQPIGNAIQGGAVAAGVLLGGSVTLFVHDLSGWTIAVLTAGALSALATLPILIVREDVGKREQEEISTKASLLTFFKRKEAIAIFVFALLFRVPEGLIKAVEQAFLVDAGFSLTKIGLISGGSAAVVGLAGSAIGMLIILRFGLKSFLWGIITLRTVCFAGYVAAAYTGLPDWALIGLSALNTFSRYMEIVGLYTAFMRIASLKQAGTDFTILSSANLLMYMVGSMLAGVIASAAGYALLFTIATVLSVITGVMAMWILPRSVTVHVPSNHTSSTQNTEFTERVT
ncbi:MFS transporter [Amylibacter sp. SFDW26]|uniref:MFS transporter n=1 Tax=Amylibacter sp. SFDW26 TaxID=2652722 RepID=UPI001262A3F5|nr:MFS transporter [Amylibacter sp. SFDW26]KAB7615846.1 MFS transporter [Amylibacter sp. SFDW26]